MTLWSINPISIHKQDIMFLFLAKANPANNVAFECSKNCKHLGIKSAYLVCIVRPNLLLRKAKEAKYF